jgi:transcription elongation factor SPT5
VTRARSLASLAPKGNILKTAGVDLSKMNPTVGTGAMTGGMVGSGTMGRGPRDPLLGWSVTINKGPHKGYVGYVKDTNGPIARVELHATNKVVTIDRAKVTPRG